MQPKRWVLAAPAPPETLRAYSGMNPILAQVLYNRGFVSVQDANRFLYVKDDGINPFTLTGMSKAVGRIRQAITRHERIVVYGDFDADGVTSTALLVLALHNMGAEVYPYIPHRVDEGYGLNVEALQYIAGRGVSLVITVDCGIRSIEEVEAGKAAGLDIIVTDHHSLGPEIPDAYAVVNPKQDGDDPLMLAGVGVAYMLVRALDTAGAKNRRKNGRNPDFEVESLLDLVAIGTVADLMPLNRVENRVLVRRGLDAIKRAPRPGVRALLEVAGIEAEKIDATGIGFGLGPRINAAGRLDSAMIAYQLLTASDIEEAAKLAHQLQDLNTRRQDKTRTAQQTISARIAEEFDGDVPLIFAGDASFEPGIVGLVAGRLVEEYFRPAVVMEMGDDESRASCRSIPQFDITGALDRCADLLVRHGGHSLAAGFTVTNENVAALRARLTELAQESLQGQTLIPTLNVDTVLDFGQLDMGLVQEMSRLEPCGHANSAPVLMTRDVEVLEARTVGREGKHLKLKVARGGQPALDAIGFGLGEWAEAMPDCIDIAYHLEVNEWNGRRSLQANLQDIRPAGGDDD